MRQYERNGVTVDQCTECRGIFLDRGELERLTSAENQYYASGDVPSAPNTYPQAGPPPAMPPRHYGSPDSPDSPNRWQQYPQQGYPQQGHRRRRKRSFLEDLFD